MNLKKTAILVIASLLTISVQANDATPSDPQQDVKIEITANKRKTPDETFTNKKLFIKFDKSTRLSTLIANKLKEKGYDIADSEESADETIEIFGKFRVNNSEIDTKVRDFADLDSQVATNNQKAENAPGTPLSHVAIAAASTGLSQITVRDFALWISGITGITGFINKTLTGDSRGFCIHENCQKTNQFAMLLIKSKSLLFDVRANIKHEVIIIDQVVDKALATGIDCFPDKTTK